MEAFENAEFDPEIHIVTTCDAALSFVYQCEEDADASKPDALFLDWILAQTAEKEVLDTLNADYLHIPVAVMTGSIPDTDPVQSSFSQVI